MNHEYPGHSRFCPQEIRTAQPNSRLAHMLLTYERLRQWLIIVTVLFLVVLAIYRQSHPLDERLSISAYYHSTDLVWRMHDWFVACLCAVGIMLIVYQGYTPCENKVLSVAGFGLIGVVVFPMDWPAQPNPSRTAILHYSCAIIFFLGLAYVCIFRARDTLNDLPAGYAARVRFFSSLYRICGALMVALPTSSFALNWFGRDDYIYLAEYSGVVVFLSYWVAKTVELRLPTDAASTHTTP